MKPFSRMLGAAILCLGAASVLAGCGALREIAALRSVDFALDRVDDAELAGVDVQRLRSYEDLSAVDAARIASSVVRGELPLRFDLIVAARNPEENEVQARMVRMDWTLFIEDRETIAGVMNQSYTLPPGEVRHIPVGIQLDLVEFFDENVRDLVELALSVTGQGGTPMNVRLEAVPSVETPVGSIRYPQPITIISGDLGRARTTTGSLRPVHRQFMNTRATPRLH